MKLIKGSVLFLVAVFFGSFFYGSSAFAMPVERTVPLDFFRAPARFNIAELGEINFEGIVALSNCSGSIVRYESSIDDDQAMVLTNGHCKEGGFINANTFVLNAASDRGFAVLEPSSGRSLGNVRAEKIIYATMTKTDVTLYRLVETYRQIKDKFGVRALTLSSRQAPIGQPIDIVSGYWKRGYSCAIEYFVDTLKEDQWTMRNSIRYTRPGCNTIGGTSGSPIVSKGTSLVVGINNTGNEGGTKCSMNNPCEVNKDGTVVSEKGVSYGQQIALIYSCLDSHVRLDLSLPTCLLPGGAAADRASMRLYARPRR